MLADVACERVHALLIELEPTIAALSRRAARTGGRRDEPSDVAQVLREAIVREAEAYEAASQPLRYVMLRAVALSHARTSRRKAKREVTGLPEGHADAGAEIADPHVDARSTLDRLSARLGALTPTQLRVVLDVLEGRSSRDSAKQLGIAEETVRWHRARAVHALGQGLEDSSLAELEAFAEAMSSALEDPSQRST